MEMPDPIIAIDAKGRILRANQAAHQYFGYEASELIGKNVSILMPSPDSELHDGYISKYLDTGIKNIIGIGRKVLIRKKDGGCYPNFLTVTEQRKVNGEFVFIGLLQDLTQIQIYENELNNLGNILATSLNEIFIFNEKDLKIKFGNQGACANLGYTETELEKLGPLDIWPKFGEHNLKEILKPLYLNEVNFLKFETVQKKKTGQLYPVEIQIQRTVFHGEPAFITFTIDRSKEMELEGDIKSILETTPAQILRLGKDLTIKYINRILQGTKITDLLGNNFLNLLEGDQREIARSAIEKAKSTMKTQMYEIKKDFNGKTHWYSSAISPVFVQSELVGYTIVAQDITENREALLGMQHTARLAQIGELAAGVGHEINNPLMIVSGNIEKIQGLIQLGDLDKASAVDRIEKTKSALNRIREIVNGLRTFSRSDTDHFNFINLVDAVDQTISLVREIYSKEGIKIVFEPGNSQVCIKASVGKVQQITMNLLSNAKDALIGRPDAEIKIKIEKCPNFITLSVADNGIGIPPEIQERIFNPFFTTKPIGKGTGIGLSLSQNLATELGAKIYCNSTPNQGANFTVHFPFPGEFPLDFKDSENNNEISTDPSFDALAVLVVDDEDCIREIFEDFLAVFGLKTILTAPNGNSALEIMKKQKVDLVITDMQMPGINGLELIRKIREGKFPSNPVCFIVTGGITTGYEKATREEISKIADGYILKPFGKADLERPLKMAQGKLAGNKLH